MRFVLVAVGTAAVLAEITVCAAPAPPTAQAASPAPASSSAQASQAKPLRRSFRAGDESRYRLRLTVRSELEGPETLKIGSVTYVKTVQRSAEARLAWTVSERVVTVAPDGTAHIREELGAFFQATHSQQPDADDADAAKLTASLVRTLSDWANSRALEFRVAANGSTSELAPDGAPKFDESPPPLLTLWLVHALRPQATLPEHPVRAGDSWQEPRRVHVAGWMGVRAGETGEWLEAPAADRAALRLHVVQEISGRVLDTPAGAAPRSREKDEDDPDAPPPASNKTERFFAESLSTIALDDGRVLAASRSARKEIIQVLPPVEGMPQPPRFRATLSVQVEIEPCVGSQCEASGNR